MDTASRCRSRRCASFTTEAAVVISPFVLNDSKIHDYENQIKSYKISYELYSELRVEREKAQSLAGLIVAFRNIGDEKSFQKYFEKSLLLKVFLHLQPLLVPN